MVEVPSPDRVGPAGDAWPWVEFGDLFAVQQGKALSAKARMGDSPQPFLRTANVMWGELLLGELDRMDFSSEEQRKYDLRAGDLLVCEGGEVGRCAVWGGGPAKIHYQNHLHRCRSVDGNVDPHFYAAWMRFSILQVGLYAGSENRTTIANLSKSRLSAFPVPQPPVTEQRAIAHVLRAVQRSREQTEQVIAGAQEFKQSLMARVFGGDGSSSDDMWRKSRWHAEPLGELVELTNGRAFRPEEWGSRGMPIIRIQNLNDAAAPFNYYAGSADERHVVNSGDLLFSWSGSRGTSFGPHLWKRQTGVLNQHIFKVRPRGNDVSIEYLAHALEYLTRLIEGRAYGLAALVHVRKGDLESTVVPVPPTGDQQTVSDAFRPVDRKIAAEEQSRHVLTALFDSLLHDLMTARLRVSDLEVP